MFLCLYRCSLFIVQGEVGTDSHCLVSDLFDVNINSTVEEMSKKTEIRIPWGSGIVGHVASSGKSVNISDCYAEEKFNPVSHHLLRFLFSFFPLLFHLHFSSFFMHSDTKLLNLFTKASTYLQIRYSFILTCH